MAGPPKRDIRSWWRTLKKTNKDEEQEIVPAPTSPTGIFGVPLQVSIKYANVAISLSDNEGHSFIYGYVPIVVAKCGVFLKEKATDVEGIFRLAGSAKRIKELQTAFDSPDRYGKGLDWTGYTVHDAASILRRYLNLLPEPIIPTEFYERFRDPIRDHQGEAVGNTEAKDIGGFDEEAAVKEYQKLITQMPPLNRQLLLYILDLLAVFASKADNNRMPAANLAAIFQPGTLYHSKDELRPDEYKLCQDVLIFLIENQDHFLIGMPGTAADAETVEEVQQGATDATQAASPPTTVPEHNNLSSLSKSTSVRSASSAKATVAEPTSDAAGEPATEPGPTPELEKGPEKGPPAREPSPPLAQSAETETPAPATQASSPASPSQPSEPKAADDPAARP